MLFTFIDLEKIVKYGTRLQTRKSNLILGDN